MADTRVWLLTADELAYCQQNTVRPFVMHIRRVGPEGLLTDGYSAIPAALCGLVIGDGWDTHLRVTENTLLAPQTQDTTACQACWTAVRQYRLEQIRAALIEWSNNQAEAEHYHQSAGPCPLDEADALFLLNAADRLARLLAEFERLDPKAMQGLSNDHDECMQAIERLRDLATYGETDG